MEEKIEVKIPRQIRTKTEFFIGFGVEELIKTIIVAGISAVISYIIYLISKQILLSTIIVIGTVIVTVLALIKGNNNFSMIDIIKNIVKFKTMQKKYKYKGE